MDVRQTKLRHAKFVALRDDKPLMLSNNPLNSDGLFAMTVLHSDSPDCKFVVSTITTQIDRECPGAIRVNPGFLVLGVPLVGQDFDFNMPGRVRAHTCYFDHVAGDSSTGLRRRDPEVGRKRGVRS